MEFNLASFLLGGFVFLFGFLAVMGWVIRDEPARKAMTWLATGRNFSIIGLVAGLCVFSLFIFMVAIAIVKLLPYVQMDAWVWIVMGIGLGFSLISLAVLLLTHRHKSDDKEVKAS